MDDPIARVLHLVAEGRLTAEEAAPILDALSAKESSSAASTTSSSPRSGDTQDAGPSASSSGGSNGARFARIQVIEGGRRVVDLRVPTSLGKFALARVPGLSTEHVAELQRAISTGLLGPLLEVEDPDGDGVRIVLE